jgi:hypothetical protein
MNEVNDNVKKQKKTKKLLARYHIFRMVVRRTRNHFGVAQGTVYLLILFVSVLTMNENLFIIMKRKLKR